MANKDSTAKTLGVALVLCIVCSIIVSFAAVSLRPLQQENKDVDMKRNILLAAGLYDDSLTVEEQFKEIKTRVIELKSGKFVDVDPATYDQRKASKDPEKSEALDGDLDIAKISRLEKYALVYIVESSDGFEKVILPVRGYGLWSTLYGFIALEKDLNTVAGLGFYQHGETPGLGGEVDNPGWKALWPGKQVYDNGEVKLGLVKGPAVASSPTINYEVDGLSGATLTGKGVTNLVQFWMGQQGYKTFLENFKRGDA